MSQGQIAKLLGISRSYLTHIKLGQRRCPQGLEWVVEYLARRDKREEQDFARIAMINGIEQWLRS